MVENTNLTKANVIVGEQAGLTEAQLLASTFATKKPGTAYTVYSAVTETVYTPPKNPQGTFSNKTFGEGGVA